MARSITRDGPSGCVVSMHTAACSISQTPSLSWAEAFSYANLCGDARVLGILLSLPHTASSPSQAHQATGGLYTDWHCLQQSPRSLKVLLSHYLVSKEELRSSSLAFCRPLPTVTAQARLACSAGTFDTFASGLALWSGWRTHFQLGNHSMIIFEPVPPPP